MVPTKSSATSTNCPDGMGSDCVTWSGGQLCSANICGGPLTLTQVVTALDTAICTQTAGAPCYTGNWIPFFASIPASGSSPLGIDWTVSDFGSSENGQTENFPEYKWTKEGDLELRGSFHLKYINNGPPSITGHFQIPLVTISPSCFPANFNKSQLILLTVECFSQNAGGSDLLNIFFRGQVQLIHPTGELVMLAAYFSPIPFTPYNDYIISFGGTRFNLA